METGCEYEKWTELAQDHVQWQIYVPAVKILWIKLQKNYL